MKMTRSGWALFGGFVVNSLMIAALLMLVSDLVVTLAGIAVIIAYGSITAQILSGDGQARLAQERHEEIVAVLTRIAENKGR
ncbi:MAG: hypothetical protein F4185_00205 [Chloroflexi bacterium]|nr:hypothetical protein [Chloroflexota bacterium]MYF64457.1 hypothetical protein [Chloroflexota bacterium]MYK35176.1 hypothetical protein [Chloroflexota bacterium]